jgi:hypothetical protein
MPDMFYIHRSRTEEEKEQWLEQSHVTLTQNNGPDLNCKDYPVTAIAMPIQVVFCCEDPLINNRKTPLPSPPSQPSKDLTPLAKVQSEDSQRYTRRKPPPVEPTIEEMVYRDKSHIRLELLGARMPGNLPTSTTFTRVEMEEIRSIMAQVIYAETFREASNEPRNGKKGG